MRGKKHKNNTNSTNDQSQKKRPDHQIKPINGDKKDEAPEIYNIVKRGDSNSQNRRDFIKNFSGSMGLSAIAGALNSCNNSDFSINTDGATCTCHVVCACDTEEDDKKSQKNARWRREYDGSVCTCDAVCTCDLVCSCDTVCTCDTEGGGGDYGHYWYPC